MGLVIVKVNIWIGYGGLTMPAEMTWVSGLTRMAAMRSDCGSREAEARL